MFLFVSFPSGSEWFIILVVALLLFGKRLPEVARSMGKSITEFKKGLHGLEEGVKGAVNGEEENRPGQSSSKEPHANKKDEEMKP